MLTEVDLIEDTAYFWLDWPWYLFEHCKKAVRNSAYKLSEAIDHQIYEQVLKDINK